MATRGVNKVILVGNVGQDPDVKTFEDGGMLANVSLATSESWKDKNSGEQQERTEWHRIVFRGGLAQVVQNYVKKGSKIYVEGKLQTRKWQDQEGNDRYTTEVSVDITGQMQMLDSPANGSNNNQTTQTNQSSDNGKSNESNNSGGKVQAAKNKQNQQPAASNPSNESSDATAPEPVDDFDDDIPF